MAFNGWACAVSLSIFREGEMGGGTRAKRTLKITRESKNQRNRDGGGLVTMRRQKGTTGRERSRPKDMTVGEPQEDE
ncbi:uncharacterized protein SPSK_08215 [Sporothrix schenckii 1099-18]|uniref:Uncharacterized protein n=1 Tax=Sporothrix schenckii 1099-18 TaxID=1397361 RepID=A0A0F2MFY5_SPOSC|nr:uncharacterized protein SPSK_08215 [Sporothrix schenckii 1099-18]KJR88613.1 hypothetical protein SPSK_08215 [Sporothrix schenckii 1099-18]